MEFLRGGPKPIKRLHNMVSSDRQLHGTRGIQSGAKPGELGVPSGRPTRQNQKLLESMPQPKDKPRNQKDIRFGIG